MSGILLLNDVFLIYKLFLIILFMNIMLNQSQKFSYMKEYNEKRISEKE